MKHRKFTVRIIQQEQAALVIVADYMDREDHGASSIFKFYVKRKWWQRDLLVGCFEARYYSQVSSEETTDGISFLSEIGVRG